MKTMNENTVTLTINVPRNDLVSYAKNPCLKNWDRLVKSQARDSICDHCPFRDSMRRFIQSNAGSFSQSQLALLETVKSRWG